MLCSDVSVPQHSMNVKSWSVLDTKNRDVMDRDDILSKFIDHTHVEPSLASDLLDATEWDLTQALTTFEGMKDIYVCTGGVPEHCCVCFACVCTVCVCIACVCTVCVYTVCVCLWFVCVCCLCVCVCACVCVCVRVCVFVVCVCCVCACMCVLCGACV